MVTTAKTRVQSLLKRKWVTSSEIETIAGPGGTRRVRELRASGAPVVKRYNANIGSFQYRIK